MTEVIILSRDGMELMSVSHPERVTALMTLNKGDAVTVKINEGIRSMRPVIQKGFDVETNVYTIILAS